MDDLWLEVGFFPEHLQSRMILRVASMLLIGGPTSGQIFSLKSYPRHPPQRTDDAETPKPQLLRQGKGLGSRDVGVRVEGFGLRV